MKGSGVRFIVFMAVMTILGSVGLLFLATAVQDVTFIVNDKHKTVDELANRITDLEAQLTAAGSMSGLAEKAQDLGMKPNPHPAQIQLPEGKISGNPVAANGQEIPAATYHSLSQRQRMRAVIEERAKVKAAKKKAKEKQEAKEKKEAAAQEAKKASQAKAKAQQKSTGSSAKQAPITKKKVSGQ